GAGGVTVGTSGGGGQGGGLYISGVSALAFEITGSPLSNTTAAGGIGGSDLHVGGNGGDGQGGGLFASGGSVILRDSSVTSNTAAGGNGYSFPDTTNPNYYFGGDGGSGLGGG